MCWSEVDGCDDIDGDDLEACSADLSAFISSACFAIVSFRSRRTDGSVDGAVIDVRRLLLPELCTFLLDGMKEIEFCRFGSTRWGEDALHSSNACDANDCSSIGNLIFNEDVSSIMRYNRRDANISYK